MQPVKVGVVGLGFMGSHYARILHQTPNAELAAVADLDADRTAALATALGVPGFGGIDDLLQTGPDVSAVVVTTPEAAHEESAIAAASAGKHLLVEKPLAMTVDGCRRISDACARAGVMLMVAHHSHFDPRFGELKRQLEAGTLGRIVTMYARRNMYTASAERISRRVSLALWAGVHDIEVMQWYAQQPVRRVMASATPAGDPSSATPDAMAAILEFADGSLGLLEYSWVAPPLQGDPHRFYFGLVATGGFAEVDYGHGGLEIYTPTAALAPDMMFQPRVGDRLTGQYREQILYFLDCIQIGRAPIVNGEQATAAVAIANAIDVAIAEQRDIRLPLS
jgi:predicted dehydrogenase